jgi:outer membrane protein assembly factor BamB
MGRPRHYRDRVARRLGKCKYCRVLLVIMTSALAITLLMVTNVWDPRPAIGDFLSKLTRLSVPEPKWTVQIDGAPDVTAVTADRVVVASRGFVEAYRTSDMAKQWEWPAYWAFPAGDVVVARQKSEEPGTNRDPELGYSVIDPGSGIVTWREHDAIAVWIYAGAIVDLLCPDPSLCQLRRRDHVTGAIVWTAALPGAAKTIRGPNPHVAGVRNPAEWFAKAALGTPAALPTHLVFTIEGRIYIVETRHRDDTDPATPPRVREVAAPDRETQVSFIGGRLLFVRAERADAGCHFKVEAFDIESGESEWVEPGFDLDTARGAGCDQRLDPLGAGARLVVTGSDAKPMLVEADKAARTWTGVPGEKVLATDGLLAVILAADGTHVTVIDAASAGGRVLFQARVGFNAKAAITQSFVIIKDVAASKILVLRRGASTMSVKLELKSKADVVGVGVNAILISTARYVGYHEVRP